MYRYMLIEEELYSPDLGKYHSFGIIALDNTGKVITFVSDVSPDKALVEGICNRCTKGQLYPIHLLDVIEDSI